MKNGFWEKHLKIYYQKDLFGDKKNSFQWRSWLQLDWYFKRNCWKKWLMKWWRMQNSVFLKILLKNKEEYRYRTIFEEHFPKWNQLLLTVPSHSFSSLFYTNCFGMGPEASKKWMIQVEELWFPFMKILTRKLLFKIWYEEKSVLKFLAGFFYVKIY